MKHREGDQAESWLQIKTERLGVRGREGVKGEEAKVKGPCLFWGVKEWLEYDGSTLMKDEWRRRVLLVNRKRLLDERGGLWKRSLSKQGGRRFLTRRCRDSHWRPSQWCRDALPPSSSLPLSLALQSKFLPLTSRVIYNPFVKAKFW